MKIHLVYTTKYQITSKIVQFLLLLKISITINVFGCTAKVNESYRGILKTVFIRIVVWKFFIGSTYKHDIIWFKIIVNVAGLVNLLQDCNQLYSKVAYAFK